MHRLHSHIFLLRFVVNSVEGFSHRVDFSAYAVHHMRHIKINQNDVLMESLCVTCVEGLYIINH